MNVGIFNIVNHKNKESGGMYAEWSSLPLEGGGRGVLGAVGGRDVVLAVMRQLASHEPSPLTTDAEVEWVLEVVRFGLALPLSEHEAVRDCVRVCCAWLAPLLPAAAPPAPPPPATPAAVRAQPQRYARKLLRHLRNLFLPRPDESGDLISKQAVLCHRVLRLARALAGGGALGAAEWRALLLLLLAAAAALLAPPAPHHQAAHQLCDRVLCVLFEVWILACHRCFPTPPLWRTLREQCIRWRHRAPLTEQWTRASLCLTARLLKHMYGPTFPAMPISEEDANLVPADMSAEAVMQSWYRMLHTIGNPVDLCRPHLISQTPDFLQYSMSGEAREPWQHPCLAALPGIFHKAMRGLAAHVDAFLGRGSERWWVECGPGGGTGAGTGGGATAGGVAGGGASAGGGADSVCEEDTPPAHRRLAKSFSVSTSRPRDKPPDKSTPRTSLIGLTGSRPPSVAPTTPPNSISSQVCEKPPLAPLRPKVNSIFHLFGEWLFEASLIGTTPAYNNSQQRADGTPPPPSLSDAQYKLNMLSYQPGRAEALGAVCRVLCSKQSREEVLAPYLARCLAALRLGLRDPHTAAAVVLNAPDLFRLDLDGVLVLVPDYISALDKILSEREPKLECGGIDKRELRKAAISALLSLVAFPYHYRGLPVPEFPGCNEYAGVTLGSLTRGKLSLMCVAAVQVEWSDALAVPLLSALYLCVRHHAPPPANNASATAAEYKARSDSGSATGSDGHSSLEDFAADVRELDPSSPVFGAALVVRATYLVCHRLISSWKGDLQVSLAALELLSGLAKLHSAKPEATERKRAVRWICDYISVQCGRPPQAHSRDLHSCVVAAYACLAAWLCPALLRDRACLAALLEVVELGISGTKSHSGKPGEPPKMKDEKELKPVSMRVRDAAESLLMLILEQTGVGGLGGESWCRLDERWLSALGHGRLRHFVADGGVLLSLLEEPLANSQEPQPTLIAAAARRAVPGACGSGVQCAPATCWSPPRARRPPAARCRPRPPPPCECVCSYVCSARPRHAGARPAPAARLPPAAARARRRPVSVCVAMCAVRARDMLEPAPRPPPACRPLPPAPAAALARPRHAGARPAPAARLPPAAARARRRPVSVCVAMCAVRARDMLEPAPRPPPACRPLPPAPAAALDSAFPTLESVVRQLNDPDAPTLFKLLEQQAAIEKRVRESEDNVVPEEYVPPEPVTEFQTARLFLSHFGYLNIGGDKKGGAPRLAALRGSAGGFARALRRLDATGARAALTVHVFCARAGRAAARHMLADVRAPGAPAGFLRMLRGLGQPVRVRGHGGWAGHVARSYDAPPTPRPRARHAPAPADSPACYDGREQILYWADSTNEIAFIVPSGYETDSEDRQNDSIKSDIDGSCVSVRSSTASVGGAGSSWDVSSCERAADKPRGLALELDKQNTSLTGSGRRNRDFTTKILIIWLEDFEDHVNLPIDELLAHCETGVPWRRHEVCALCVSARRSGLVRVRAARGCGALPDGALLAPRLLPDCLRRAALDAARRDRLHTDLYQPPHVRRRHLIQELAQNYKMDLTEPELLESLFKPPP
ncbi:LOW QUALITY PROTEIN: ral GTPase-activating protein subunit beta-like [Aphomia sociella]